MRLEEYQKKYLDELVKAKEPAIRTFIDKAEKMLIPYYKQLYEELYRWLGILISYGIILRDPFLIAAKERLQQRGISVSLWIKYIVINAYLIPLHSSIKTKNTNIEKNIREVINQLKVAVSTIQKQLADKQVVVEGVVGNIWKKLKTIVISSVKKLASSLVIISSSIISLYNDIFSLIAIPIRKLVSSIPGGSYLLSFTNVASFYLFNNTPVVALILRVHNIITNPTLQQGVTVARNLITGDVWEELEKMFNELSKDVNWEELDKVLEKEEEVN